MKNTKTKNAPSIKELLASFDLIYSNEIKLVESLEKENKVKK